MSLRSVALALLAGGVSRIGKPLIAKSPTHGREARLTVAVPVLHDVEGTRYRD